MHRDLFALRWLLVLAAGAGNVPLLHAQSSEGRFPLTPQTIAAGLQSAGLEVKPEQLEMPSFLTATSATPTLRINAVDVLPGGSLRLRLACGHPNECVPFLIAVSGVENVSSTIAAMRQSRPSAGDNQINGRLLQAGQHTTLFLQANHMVISLPVVAIDSGRPGTEIRVSSSDHKQTYVGIVTEQQTVRGTLP